MKLNSNGAIQWQKTYGIGEEDSARYIKVTSDGEYIIIVHTQDLYGHNPIRRLIKLDVNGNIQWLKSYSGYANAVEKTSDGGYVVAGDTYTCFSDVWVMKLDENGGIGSSCEIIGSSLEASVKNTTVSPVDSSVPITDTTVTDSTATVSDMNAIVTTQCYSTTSNAPVLPDIKAQSIDGSVTIHQTEKLSVTVSLHAGNKSGMNADWWYVAFTPFGLCYYAEQGPLLDISSTEIVNITNLPVGTYSIYFGIDTNMNGEVDFDSLYYDSVVVNIY